MKKVHLKLLKILNSMSKSSRSDHNLEPAKVEFDRWIAKANEIDDLKVLEVGSRNVTGHIGHKSFPKATEYVGMDVLPGENVDIVGDAHALSSLVPNNHFDVVYSVAVFEHLMFPWKAAMEINRVLKPGGYVFTITHPAWPEHEMPWDFWRFPKNAFRGLFNPITGFELLASDEGLGMRPIALTTDPAMQDMYKHKLNGVVFSVARKTGPYDKSKLKWDLVPGDVSEDMYPSPKQ
ncbi:class I SAM-dependent methyltransferase [uncultured Tateyamaria sp.]|uniref:class I SAM-dependent methyltransferase n=1 Tax=uncultured Tateyamaria sp. TaxID=455651 RepID=UPI0026109B4D|nr:class I SAM-dependent methyltransferase [uncultured Tateyamaria sp.]